MFEFVDLDSSKTIEFKEFLVAMTVGHVLEIVPTFQGMSGESVLETSKRDAAKSEYSTEMSCGSNKTEDIHKMLNLIVSAYLLFDPKARGYINRGAVESLIGEGKHRNAMLSQHRWNEMVTRHLLAFYFMLIFICRIGTPTEKSTLLNSFTLSPVGSWILRLMQNERFAHIFFIYFMW